MVCRPVPSSCRQVALVLLVGAAFAGSPLSGAVTVTITHEPAACILAGRFPVIEAGVEASEAIKSLRVYFHAKGASFWSYTEMKPEGGVFRATLTRPTEGGGEVYYHFVAIDAAGS